MNPGPPMLIRPVALVPPAPPAPAGETLRILLVEDSPPDAAMIKHILRTTGRALAVVQVDNREAFEAELSRRPPDLILSDYALPAFDGGRALEIAKQIAPQIPFIFVTGTLGEEVAIDMLKQGATDYVLKNRLTRLAPAVSRALSENQEKHERRRAEEKLRRSHDQLRALTGHLQFVREEERTRIAREVHDELGQALTSLKLDVAWLAGKRAGAHGVKRKLKTMSGQLDETIQAVRRIATEMRPGVLDTLGLAAAIEWQAAEFQDRTGIHCEMTIEVTEKLWEREFSTACFRIFQETLTNITRHAAASCVKVRLARVADDMVLTVHDNGCGITEKDLTRPDSIGLMGMKERAGQLGGEVTFSGGPAAGTTVIMRVPFPAAVANELAAR